MRAPASPADVEVPNSGAAALAGFGASAASAAPRAVAVCSAPAAIDAPGDDDAFPVPGTAIAGDDDGLVPPGAALAGDDEGFAVLGSAIAGDDDGLVPPGTAIAGDDEGFPVLGSAIAGDDEGLVLLGTAIAGDDEGFPVLGSAIAGDDEGFPVLAAPAAAALDAPVEDAAPAGFDVLSGAAAPVVAPAGFDVLSGAAAPVVAPAGFDVPLDDVAPPAPVDAPAAAVDAPREGPPAAAVDAVVAAVEAPPAAPATSPAIGAPPAARATPAAVDGPPAAPAGGDAPPAPVDVPRAAPVAVPPAAAVDASAVADAVVGPSPTFAALAAYATDELVGAAAPAGLPVVLGARRGSVATPAGGVFATPPSVPRAGSLGRVTVGGLPSGVPAAAVAVLAAAVVVSDALFAAAVGVVGAALVVLALLALSAGLVVVLPLSAELVAVLPEPAVLAAVLPLSAAVLAAVLPLSAAALVAVLPLSAVLVGALPLLPALALALAPPFEPLAPLAPVPLALIAGFAPFDAPMVGFAALPAPPALASTAFVDVAAFVTCSAAIMSAVPATAIGTLASHEVSMSLGMPLATTVAASSSSFSKVGATRGFDGADAAATVALGICTVLVAFRGGAAAGAVGTADRAALDLSAEGSGCTIGICFVNVRPLVAGVAGDARGGEPVTAVVRALTIGELFAAATDSGIALLSSDSGGGATMPLALPSKSTVSSMSAASSLTSQGSGRSPNTCFMYAASELAEVRRCELVANCSSASRMSSAVWKRRAGSSASAFVMIASRASGRSGRWCFAGGTLPPTIALIVRKSFAPLNSRRAVTSS